jgi:hypothetical protein
MRSIIPSLLILTLCGCQTAQNETPLVPQISKEVIRLHTDKRSTAYEIEVRQTEYRLDQNGVVIAESQEVLSTPRVAGKPNTWLHCNVGVNPRGLDSKISYLIDGEMIHTPAFAGVHLIAQIIPLNGTEVRVKGIFVSSVFDENRKLIHLSLPIDAVCTLGEEKILYEKEIKFEPLLSWQNNATSEGKSTP